jgi:O-antigen/teichoic acid export membrane protein
MVGEAGTFALKLGMTVVLARMLTPADFGLVAMVTAATGIIGVFKTMGLFMATVQRAEINHQQVSSLFWINFAGCVLLSVLMAALSPALAWLYGEPRLVGITCCLSTVFILDGLTVQHQALLRRQMRFGVLAASNVGCLAAGIAMAVIMASLGARYWSLVWMHITTAMAEAVVAWLVCDWRPGLPRRVEGVGSMVKYGLSVAGSSLLNRLCLSMDNMLIGAVWGARSLGLYARAYDLLLLPASQIGVPVGRIAITGLSRLQHNPAAYGRYFRAGISVIVTLGMPMTTFAFVDATTLVVLVLGEPWREVVPIFRMLAPAAFLGTFNVATLWLFLPLGRSDRQFRWIFFRTLYSLAAFAAGLPWGPLGVAAAYSVARCLMVVPELAYACSGTPIRVVDVGQAIWRPAVASIGAALCVRLAHTWISPAGLGVAHLFLDIATFLAAYLTLWLVLPGGRRFLVELLDHATHLVSRRGSFNQRSVTCSPGPVP